MQPEDIAKFRIKYPKITKLFEIINNLVSKNLVRFLLLPIIYALPVFFINSSFSNSSLAHFITENLGTFGVLIVEKQAWIIISAFLIYALITYGYLYIS